jgi:hypothetical protein
MDMKKLLDTFSQIEGKQTLTESESSSPFDWKNKKSELPSKPGEKAGFDSKKISTGTVYSRKPTKDKTDTVKESANFDESKLEQILARYNEDMEHIGLYSSGVDHSRVLELLKNGDVESAAEEIAYTFSDEDGGEPRGRDDAQYEDLKSDLENLVNPADFDNISHGTDPEQRDQDELNMLKHFMQYGKEPQPGSQMASIKDRLSAKGMSEAKDEEIEEQSVAEDDVEEGNEFTGALAKAKAEHKDEFEVDGKKYSVKECYDGSMSPMSGATQEESNLSVSTNMGTNSPLNVSVTATGGAARELMQMLRLAGLGSSEEMSDTTEPEVVIGAQEMEEDYANAPDEKYSTVDDQMNQGNDLNRPKGTYPKVAGGDNPMAMREADELAALEKQLFEELSAIKIIKK